MAKGTGRRGVKPYCTPPPAANKGAHPLDSHAETHGAAQPGGGNGTLVTAAFAHQVASHSTPTFDFGVWNIGNLWFANAILLGLAVFGFLTATRGRTLLENEAFDSATRRTA